MQVGAGQPEPLRHLGAHATRGHVAGLVAGQFDRPCVGVVVEQFQQLMAIVDIVVPGAGRPMPGPAVSGQVDSKDSALGKLRRQGIETGGIVQPAMHGQDRQRCPGMMFADRQLQPSGKPEAALDDAHASATAGKPGQPLP